MKEAFTTFFITVIVIVFWCLVADVGIFSTFASNVTLSEAWFGGVASTAIGSILSALMVSKWMEKPSNSGDLTKVDKE